MVPTISVVGCTTTIHIRGILYKLPPRKVPINHIQGVETKGFLAHVIQIGTRGAEVTCLVSLWDSRADPAREKSEVNERVTT